MIYIVIDTNPSFLLGFVLGAYPTKMVGLFSGRNPTKILRFILWGIYEIIIKR